MRTHRVSILRVERLRTHRAGLENQPGLKNQFFRHLSHYALRPSVALHSPWGRT